MNAAAIIALVVGAVGIVFSFVTLLRNKKKDDTEEGKASGAIMSDIGYIKAGVDDIKAEQKEQRKMNMDIERRLTSVEESAKQAHKRIDELKKD